MIESVKLISNIYHAKGAAGQPVISLEFFPPRTPEGDRTLMERTIPALKELRPDFCSVTYGAGGSTREKTMAIVDCIQRQHGLTALAHLTCVHATRREIHDLLEQIQLLGVKNILALRGDPPGGEGEFQPTKGGFAYASELVGFIRNLGGFCIGVAGFPEGHIACREGKYADWHHLKNKIDSGADFVLTQLFFDNQDFFTFRDHLSEKGVTVPICPGVIPILSYQQITRFTTLCGASLPGDLLAKLEALKEDDKAAAEFGIEYATRQCEELLREGAPGIHFYTLNKARSTRAVLHNLGLAGTSGPPDGDSNT